jgi:hypothetical protein
LKEREVRNLKTTKLKRAVIKEEFVAVTGNVITALILNQMIYWSERITDFDKFIEEEKERFSNEGKDIKIDLQEGWIYKSYQELKDELMLTDSLKTISRHLKKLVDLGFLDRRRNPKIFYDRKYQYRVNLLVIKNKLNEAGYELQGYKVEFPKSQNENSICQSDSLEAANCPMDGQKEKSNGQNDKPSGQNDKPSGKFDNAIPEIITEIKPEIIPKTTTTKREQENINKILKSVESKFSSMTGKKFNKYDVNVVVDLLKYPLKQEINIVQRENIIIDTVIRITRDFKLRRPNEEINSFKYFYNAIIKEFDKLDLRSDLNDSGQETKGNSQQIYIDEYGRKYDFALLSSNRKKM